MEVEQGGKNRTYRDKLSIVSEEGKRIWIYASRPKGFFYTLRLYTGYFLIVLFLILPFLKINHKPIFLADFLNRKFIFFSKIFWPQDFFVFFVIMISIIIFVILFTVIYGRFFCGWACPQSLFMEIVFRRIEWFIEGSPTKQKELNNQILTFEKFIKKTTKHLLFYAISFCIAFVILSYISGYERIVDILKNKGGEGYGKLAGVYFFSFIIYIIFSQLRELICTILCPYGRLQGVLLDKNSIGVSYDFKRGEPRGKSSDSDKGDCIDCLQCVTVCPSGIDIRNGIQLECTNCTACIDACNGVMNRVKKPIGLIRYASLAMIESGSKFKFTIRIMGYSMVLILILSFLTYILSNRTDIQSSVLRVQGTVFQEMSDGKISNLFNMKIINKTNVEQDVTIKLLSPDGIIQMAGNPEIQIKPEGRAEGVFFVVFEKDKIQKTDFPILLGIFVKNELVETKEIVFKTANQ